MSSCVSCRAELTSEARFCAACGASTESVSQSPTRALPATPTPPPRSHPSSSLSGGLAPGTLLADRYRIVALLGKGGMGEVYRAEDLRLGQVVALKFLPDELARNTSARERLAAEVRLARQVSHPNVCRVHDLEEVAGRVFLTMEFVDGEDLASLLRRIGRLSGVKALEIARQLGAGLAAAHERGVVHRDLKPANVMLDGRGHVRITDFGLAVTEGEGQGELAGTLAYMAPEQLAGKAATFQTDVFAYGLVLYELWTAKRPFAGGSIAELRAAQAQGVVVPPSSLAPEIGDAEERAILRCLAIEPARRPRTVASVLAALPGGDALAAALAAGETPSPELVAAAGEEGTLSPAKALGLFGALVLLLLALALAEPYGSALALLPPVRSAAAMEARARELLDGLVLHGETLDERVGFYVSHDEFDAVFAGPGRPSERYRKLGSTPRALRFWYRRSPRWIEPPFLESPQVYEAPTPFYAGEASIQIDGAGRLVTLNSVPAEKGLATRAPDATPLLVAAGLDPKSLGPAAPSRLLRGVPADAHLAWTGTLDGAPIQAEGYFWKGQPVAFRTFSPDERFPRLQPYEVPLRVRLARWALILVSASVVALLLALAIRNRRTGRWDLRGAGRLAIAALVVGMGTHLLLGHFVPTPSGIRINLFSAACFFIGTAVLTGLAYVALEPLLRRRFPKLLVSWTRLLSGSVRDPLVAHDVLIGLMAGVGVTLGRILAAALPFFDVAGLDLVYPAVPADLLRTRWLFGGFLEGAWRALNFGFLTIGCLLVGRLVLRRDALAWLFPFLLFAQFPQTGQNTALEIGLGIFVAALYLITLRQAGFLGLLAAFFAFEVLEIVPLSFSSNRWYSESSWIALAFFVGIAMIAARFSMGRRPIFTGAALES